MSAAAGSERPGQGGADGLVWSAAMPVAFVLLSPALLRHPASYSTTYGGSVTIRVGGAIQRSTRGAWS